MSVSEQRSVQADPNLVAMIIAAAGWIIQNSGLIGKTWAEWTHGVTNVRQWVNETDQEVEVWKLDGGSAKRDHYRVPPRQTIRADMWIPWADNPAQYADHHATLRVGGQPLVYLWQSGSAVRFHTIEEFVDGGFGVPGATGAGGDRTVVVAADPQGRIGFAFGVAAG